MSLASQTYQFSLKKTQTLLKTQIKTARQTRNLLFTLKSANWTRRDMKLLSISRTFKPSSDNMYFFSFS